jgi:hypothetical protein
MDSQTIRITIEVPNGADVQASTAVTGDVGTGVETAAAGAIDAGPPPMALLATLGDPEAPVAIAPSIEGTSRVTAGDAIDAGSFPAGLAMEMESEGPRHPLRHPEIGILASATSPVLDRQSRN